MLAASSARSHVCSQDTEQASDRDSVTSDLASQEETRSPDPQEQENAEEDDTLVSSRLAALELKFDNFEQTQKDQGRFQESTSTAERNVSGRLHIDTWGFAESSPGINVMESGTPSGVPEDRVLYRRMRIGSQGTVQPLNMSYKLEVEFSGADGSNFRDAWLGWDELAWLNTVRFGNQKRPYGLDHLNSSNFNVFMERPFIVEALNEDNRRFGIASYGVTGNQRFNWRYGMYDMDIIQSSGESVTNDWPLEFAWRCATTWWYDKQSNGRGYGHFGLSGTFAYPNDKVGNGRVRFRTRPEGRSTNQWIDTGRIVGADSYQMLNIESVFNVGAFQIVGEYMNNWTQRTGANDSDLFFHGGYFYLSYFLTGEHIPWNRELGILGRVQPYENFFSVRSCENRVERGLGAWQTAARFSYGNLNSDDIMGGIGQSATLSLNWHWNAHSKFQFNYIYGRIDDRLAQTSNGGSALVSGNYQIAGARFVIDF